MIELLPAGTAHHNRPRGLWGWLWDVLTDRAGHRRGVDLEFEEKIRTAFRFLFAEHHARVKLNYYDKRHFGNAYVDIEAESVIFPIVRDRGDIAVYLVAPWLSDEAHQWVGLSTVLCALEMKDPHSPVPKALFCGSMKRAASLVEERFAQIVDAFSPANSTTTRLKIERIRAEHFIRFRKDCSD